MAARHTQASQRDGFIASLAGAVVAGLGTLFAQGRSADRGIPPKRSLPQKEAPPRPLSKGEREARVERLETNVKDELTLEAGQEMQLMAVPFDVDGNAVHGLTAEWESENPDVASITKQGEVTALTAGKAILRASAGQKQAHVKLTVIPRAAKPSGVDGATSSIARRSSARGRRSQPAGAITQAHAGEFHQRPLRSTSCRLAK